ncbi:tetratricopeptide repeat protein [Bacteriovorax sp. BAL6_X]|uniref:tetratricopeptide repeat protein n=1 Tax=Bacteriovorax sp. BAL6_X TaxID=1201290 RepID=UPI0003866503|nr:tetratricopeptide repeat protein [Bacteriovorax sp. BAL6_X]EPZ50362.1 tetratricopeptide repeat protein [Bacteriovorax sp. BAL6_X]
MIKFRVKTKSNKVLGPFVFSELIELGHKDAIDDSCLFQKFPTGDWAPVNAIPELSELFSKIEEPVSVKEETQKEVKYAQTDSEQKHHTLIGEDKTAFNEFKFSKDKEFDIDYQEIEEKFKAKKELEDEAKDEIGEEGPPPIDKTVLVNVSSLKKKSIDKEEDEDVAKTVVVNNFRDEFDLDSDGEDSDGSDEEEGKDKMPEPEPEEVVDSDAATQMFNLAELKKEELPTKTEDYSDIELQIMQEERRLKKKPKKKVVQKHVEKKEVTNNKKRNLVVVLFLVVTIIFLLPEEKKDIQTVVVPKISFPVATEVAQPQKAQLAYKEGMALFKQEGFVNRISAANKFNLSLRYKFSGNPAISKLIHAYSDLLIDTQNKFEAGQVLSKLIRIEDSKLLSDIDVVIGAAQFYAYFQKYETAIFTIERYNYLKSNKPSIKMFSIYLNYLLKAGELDKAKIVYDKLFQAKLRTVESIDAMVNYLLLNENSTDALKLITENKEKFQSDYRFLIIYGDLLLELEKMGELNKIASILIAKYGGGSPYNFAQGLKFMGFVKAYNKDIQGATKLFQQSLKIYDDESLRDTLATLDVAGSDLTQKVISTSKIKVLIRQSKDEVALLNWDRAFELALRAVSLDETSIDAKLYLAELQVKRGYFDFAITTLTKLRALHPVNPRINYALIKANIMSYKKDEAKRLLSALSTSEKFRETFEFHMLLGLYYNLIANDKMAFDKFKAAARVNPLSDIAQFEMAKIAFKNKKFKQTKIFLNEAMGLNPSNIDYKILNSKVLYETDGVTTAIGYLRQELLEHRDNPKLYGQIAVFYYRDQNYEAYREMKEVLDRLNKKDGALYSYLVEVSEIERNYKELIENAIKLLVYEPGNLLVREKLIITYIHMNNYGLASQHLDILEKRLPTYPRINYYRSKILFSQRKFRDAEKAALVEIEKHPNSEFGYYMLGEIYLIGKKVQEAKKNLSKAIQINKNYFDAIFSMGKLTFQTREFVPSLQFFQRANRLNPNDPDLNKMMGFLYKELGQPNLAIDKFQRYLTLSPAARDRQNILALINALKR